MAERAEPEQAPPARTYLWWAALFAGAVAVLGSQAILKHLELRPELVKEDKGFLWAMKALRSLGWAVLAYCVLVVVVGLQRLPGQKGGSEGGEV